MEKKIIFTNLEVEELKALLKESVSETIKEELSTLFAQTGRDNSQELLSRKQVAKMYNVSFVTLRDWEKNNIIPKPIRMGSRVYWRKADIINNINSKGGNYAK
jgi:predicted DNA-binding transcriptional regulator AlpA